MQQAHLPAKDQQLKPVISAGTMSERCHTQCNCRGCTTHSVCHGHTHCTPGCTGPNASVGNTSDINVGGSNSGNIGSGNSINIRGGLGHNASVGNTTGVTAGNNCGSIGSGNSINMK
ncbi:uncharacterized [Lates japonicus]